MINEPVRKEIRYLDEGRGSLSQDLEFIQELRERVQRQFGGGSPFQRDVCKGSLRVSGFSAPCVRRNLHSTKASFSPWVGCDNKNKNVRDVKMKECEPRAFFELCWLASILRVFGVGHGVLVERGCPIRSFV